MLCCTYLIPPSPLLGLEISAAPRLFYTHPTFAFASSQDAAMQLWTRPLDYPIPNLAVLFTVWKVLLLVIAVLSPGPGYDTSTGLALSSQNEYGNNGLPLSLPPGLRHISEKLTRWDGIYFVKVANRGYLFEQEWAWGWGFTKSIALSTAGGWPWSFLSASCSNSV